MNTDRTAAAVLVTTCLCASLLLVACSGPTVQPQTTPRTMMGGGTANSSGSTSAAGAGSYTSVGQRIWLTGVGGDGVPIAHSAPRISQGALMMGGGGCASCHGADGRGGTIQMMMGPAIKAPDVTYQALVKAGYTQSTIGRAITDGLDEQGKALDQEMPRWRMSAADVQATIAYMKVLGSR